MPLITEKYREMNRKLHQTHASYGTSAGYFQNQLAMILRTEGHANLLDYGCGKGLVKQMFPDVDVREYDPAIPGKDALPEPADLVTCIDVLEHIEPENLNAVLRHLQSVTRRKLFFNISTRQATKTLEDGRNAHLIVRPADWWRRRMRRHFKITAWEVGKHQVYGEAFPITGPVIRYEDMPKRKRRPIPHQMRQMFDVIRDHSARYSDAAHRIDTIRMFEGVGDSKADMQVLCNILEDCDDIDLVLKEACELARLSVMVTMQATEDQGKLWRRVFERRLRIADWHFVDGAMVMTGSPMIGVQGITAVGAVEDTQRWDQTVANIRRTDKRIEPAPAHDKVAVLCCYGPSLKGMIPSIKEAQAAGGIVVSVSGAHDFLLANGITPSFHVECDPRLHKADNIDKAQAGVEYLVASVCHPGYFDKLQAGAADIRLWHISSAEHTIPLVDEMGEKADHIISGGGSVGLRSIPLLYAMGYRHFAIYGMDSSFDVPADVIAQMRKLMEDPAGEPEALKIAEASCQQWAGKHAGKRQTLCTVLCGERMFVASPILLTYATGFFETIQKMPDVQFRVYGDHLLKSMCELYAGMPQLNADKAAA